VEVLFYGLQRLRYHRLNKVNLARPSTLDVDERFRNFLTLSPVLDIRDFISGWFLNIPFSEIRAGNVADFIAYAYWYPSPDLLPCPRLHMRHVHPSKPLNQDCLLGMRANKLHTGTPTCAALLSAPFTAGVVRHSRGNRICRAFSPGWDSQWSLQGGGCPPICACLVVTSALPCCTSAACKGTCPVLMLTVCGRARRWRTGMAGVGSATKSPAL
jgi:hypothetical protein